MTTKVSSAKADLHMPPSNIVFFVVLTWVSIYWFSRSGATASIRIYYEAFGPTDIATTGKKPAIPHGISYFPKELEGVPRM